MTQLGELLRDDGIRRAVNHAERVEPDWAERAYFCVIQIARKGRPFTCEDVKIHAAICRMPDPPDARAWGGILRHAAKQGLIRKVGWAASTSPVCHCRPMQVWVAA